MKIIENVYLVPNVVANPFIITDVDGLTIIDVGVPFSEKKILAYIADIGRSPHDLKRIILTHSDVDHVGSLAALQKATGARTYASQIEANAIAVGRPSRKPNPPGFSLRRSLFGLIGRFVELVKPVQVDEILSDGQTLPILGGLQVVETPGHTPGHISLFSTSTGILFCGDSMATKDDSIQGAMHPGVTWDQAKAQESIKRQAALGATIVCSGHGPVVMDAIGKFPA